MAVEVHGLPTDDGEVVLPPHGVRRVLDPLPVDPGPHLDELAEVDLRIEVGREVSAVSTGVDVEDVDRVNRVEVLPRRARGVRVDNAGVEAGPEDRRQPTIGATLSALPL